MVVLSSSLGKKLVCVVLKLLGQLVNYEKPGSASCMMGNGGRGCVYTWTQRHGNSHSNMEGEVVTRVPEGTGRSPEQWIEAEGDKRQAEGQDPGAL